MVLSIVHLDHLARSPLENNGECYSVTCPSADPFRFDLAEFIGATKQALASSAMMDAASRQAPGEFVDSPDARSSKSARTSI